MYAVVVLALLAVVAAEEKYTTKYDGIDVDQIIHNERLLNNYFECLMDRGTCTPDGAELKKHMHDALETECSKCSGKQKEMTKKVIKFLYKDKKDMFSELETKYDPDKKYRNKYKKEAEKEGLKV